MHKFNGVFLFNIHPSAKKSAVVVLQRDVESNHASSCTAVICTPDFAHNTSENNFVHGIAENKSITAVHSKSAQPSANL